MFCAIVLVDVMKYERFNSILNAAKIFYIFLVNIKDRISIARTFNSKLKYMLQFFATGICILQKVL